MLKEIVLMSIPRNTTGHFAKDKKMPWKVKINCIFTWSGWPVGFFLLGVGGHLVISSRVGWKVAVFTWSGQPLGHFK